jgi:putative CocE/NonD family hydrolase
VSGGPQPLFDREDVSHIKLPNKRRRKTCLLFLLLFLAASCCAQSVSPIVIETDARVKMRDGISLSADIYRPGGNGKYPVLLVRTPYDKSSEGETCRAAAEHGYVCISQDVRGRYASLGEWYPFKNESSDGYDTVEWAVALPYSDGRVGMFGESYVGATQWLAAISRPPHLVAIQPSVTASDHHDGWVYQGGAFELWFDQSWTSILAVDTLQRAAMNRIPALEWAQRLPESDFPVLQLGNPAKLAPYYFDWLAHPDDDSYWKRWSIEEHYSETALAAYHVGGWYDVFLRGTLRNYVGMRAYAPSQWARDHQQLTIGPWIHDGPMNGKAGSLDFGSAAAFNKTQTILTWYDQIFKHESPQRKRVRIFVMGINQWREEDDWPIPRTAYTRYYLNSAGHANSSSGNGSLSAHLPDQSHSDTFTYDPANPVPTRGGNLCCLHDQVTQEPSGAFDQAEIEKRNDVLIYTTAAFDQDFEVTGPLTAELYISSSAADTDLTAKLVDVWPNGFAQNLADNVQRLRYRNAAEKADLLQPGKIYKVVIDVGATSNVFREGHRLRLELSSSNFPRFDRNFNTAESPERGTKFVSAENRIYHDAEHPSAIVLPVIPLNDAVPQVTK